VVFYENERGKKICEYLRGNDTGLIVQGSAIICRVDADSKATGSVPSS